MFFSGSRASQGILASCSPRMLRVHATKVGKDYASLLAGFFWIQGSVGGERRFMRQALDRLKGGLAAVKSTTAKHTGLPLVPAYTVCGVDCTPVLPAIHAFKHSTSGTGVNRQLGRRAPRH